MNKLTLLLLAIVPMIANAQRSETLLEEGWTFTREDNAQSIKTDFDDSKWQKVRVPHDWAIYGPFSWDNDRQNVAITQDGQKEAMEHAGRTGGLPFVGTGWYRLKFDAPDFGKGKRAYLMFDGAMSHARVYVNEREVGYWPYGYNSFYIDITDAVKPDGKGNLLAVRLENLPESSRWYPGAGLYRNVHFRIVDEAHIDVWGIRITTPEVNKDFARVVVAAEIKAPDNGRGYTVETKIIDADGKIVAEKSKSADGLQYNDSVVSNSIIVNNPKLWTPDTPNLYMAVTSLKRNGETVDTEETQFGIRTIEVKPGVGFLLNGVPTKFKGVCNHHDLGMLGAAVNDAAIRRQIRIMKDMGANAIRTSHNMPAPELIRACNEMGMMVMAESFDEWRRPKVKNGYNLLFDEWADKDLTNLIRHFRNDPSIVMWCIGNEVSEQWHDGDCKVALYLQYICHREDPTRPVTQGMDAPDKVVGNNFAAVMDVPGFNYRPFKYIENYNKLPQGMILGSETASTVSSRGVYKFPVERKAMATYPDHQASSYDVEHCGWSNLPEDDFIQHDLLPYAMGEFVWTGFDYLGEPTPYYTNWPSHSSLFGIVDLAGIPKDRYYLYRSHWNPNAETLHITPHWTWPGREGEVTPIFVYTNYPSAELFINGKSQGIRSKDMTIGIDSTYTEQAQRDFVRQKRYRLMWMDTRYEPGDVKVIAYDTDGNPVAEKSISTAGKPYAIKLEADRDKLKSDGRDMSFITVSVVDKEGRLVPGSDNLIKFNVTGAGTFEAVANGNPASLESFQAPYMKAFSGQLTAVVRTGKTPGITTLKATSKGLKGAEIKIVGE